MPAGVAPDPLLPSASTGSSAPPLSGLEIRHRTGAVVAALALMTAAFVLSKTARDALYFRSGELVDLPWAYIGQATLSLPVALVTLSAMHHIGGRRMRVLAPLAAAAGLAALSAWARPGAGPGMTIVFMSIPLVFGVLFSLAWLLLADLFGGSPSSVLPGAYASVGAGSLAGGAIGALAARTAAVLVAPQVLFLAAAAAMVLAAVVMGLAQARYPSRCHVVPRRPNPRPMPLRAVTAARVPLLLAMAMAAALSGLLVEFLFYAAASRSVSAGGPPLRLFADVYLGLNLVALVVHVFALPRLQRRLGTGGSLMVLPSAVLLLTLAALWIVSPAARAMLRLTEGGLKSSIHRVAWEQAFAMVAPTERPAAKLLAEGTAARLAEGVGGAVLLWALWSGSRPDPDVGTAILWAGGLLLACGLAWVLATVAFWRRFHREAGGGTSTLVRVPDS